MLHENLYIRGWGRSPLSPACQRAVRALSDTLSKRPFLKWGSQNIQSALDSYYDQISIQPPDTILSAATHIRVLAGMYSFYQHYEAVPEQTSLFYKVDKQIKKMDEHPELATLFIFHGDGYVREAALKRIDPRRMNPFLFSAIVFRLNDWVAPVRAASAELLGRIRSTNHPDQYLSALPFLSVQTLKWHRWQGYKEAFNSILSDPKVIERLVLGLVVAQSGPLLRQLRVLLFNPVIDCHLPLLAQASNSPQLRAAAMGALLNNEVRWQIGVKDRWVDKSFGIKRRVPIWETRTLSQAVDVQEFIRIAAQDKSVIVRRLAATRIYKFGAEISGVDDLIALLAKDKSPSIRQQVGYFSDKARSNDQG